MAHVLKMARERKKTNGQGEMEGGKKVRKKRSLWTKGGVKRGGHRRGEERGTIAGKTRATGPMK